MGVEPLGDTGPQSAVWAGWRRVERLERSSGQLARARRAVLTRVQHRLAKAALPSLNPWPLLPARSFEVYRGRADQIRMWRVCRLLSADDRILDIGMGHGWLAGVVHLAVRPQAYAGIDLTDTKFDSVHAMARANGLDAGAWFLGVKDLYDLTRDWVSEHDPSIVMLLEVLEHLPDPQRALRTIAEAMPPRADLLFSVPMLGRVEACWGHVSLFDAARVRWLCHDAGLHVHWVEPVADTWQLVLTSTSPDVPARLSRYGDRFRRPRIEAADGYLAQPSAPAGDFVFHQVALVPGALVASAWSRHLHAREAIRNPTGGVRLHARAGWPVTPDEPFAGVAFRVDGLRGLRLELAVSTQPPSGVRRLLVEGTDENGLRTAGWAFQPSRSHPLPATSTTFVMRLGRGDGGFRPVATGADPASTRKVEVVAQLEPGVVVSIMLRRAAYIR